jgi:hypothetical protein
MDRPDLKARAYYLVMASLMAVINRWAEWLARNDKPQLYCVPPLTEDDR